MKAAYSTNVMFAVRRGPLVAVVIITAAKEEVRRSRIKRKKNP